MANEEIGGMSAEQLLERFESMCYDRKVDYQVRAELLARLAPHPVHKHTRGGNDYISCDDCGQEWDYRKPETEPPACVPPERKYCGCLLTESCDACAPQPAPGPRCPKCGDKKLELWLNMAWPASAEVGCDSCKHVIKLSTPADFAQFFSAPSPQRAVGCKARAAGTSGGNDPQDCDWPVCGCDEKASEVIEALIESGWQSPKEARMNAEKLRRADLEIEALNKEIAAAVPGGVDVPNIGGTRPIDRIASIIKKCEFYWNLDGVCDAEIHAVLERIHEHATALRKHLSAVPEGCPAAVDVEELRPWLKHKDDCQFDRCIHGATASEKCSPTGCTCGLDEVLRKALKGE